MTVTISEYIEIYDNAIHKTTTYKFVKRVNNTRSCMRMLKQAVSNALVYMI